MSTNATCSTNPAWPILYNGLGESPCYVVQQLQAPCFNGTAPFLSNLNAQTGWYYIPDRNCGCTIEGYNLFSACAACQRTNVNDSLPTWVPLANWTTACQEVQVHNPPGFNLSAASQNVPIPSWAHNTPSGTTFDINSLLASLALSESTSTPAPTSTSTPPPDNSNSHRPAHSGHSIAGPVAGGVIGGLAILAIVVLLLLYRRRRSGDIIEKVRHDDNFQVESPTRGMIVEPFIPPLSPPDPPREKGSSAPVNGSTSIPSSRTGGHSVDPPTTQPSSRSNASSEPSGLPAGTKERQRESSRFPPEPVAPSTSSRPEIDRASNTSPASVPVDLPHSQQVLRETDAQDVGNSTHILVPRETIQHMMALLSTAPPAYDG